MAEDQNPVITLGSKEIDPAEIERYRQQIAEAKKAVPLSALKGQEVVGGVPRPQMPMLAKRSDGAPAAEAGGVQPRPPGSPPVRPETVQQIGEALKAGKEQDEAAKKEAEKPKIDPFELFDFGDQRRRVDRILDNKKRREEIEKRCKPMSFEDLLMKNEVQQRVPILPGQFEPLFRSITPEESLFIKGLMAKESVQTEQYMGEKYTLLLLTCCLVDINTALLPEHRKFEAGGGYFSVDEKAFDEKLRNILHKSGYVIADLAVNYEWFDIRVRKLLNPDELGNG